MKNRILILGLLALTFSIIKLFFYNIEKPIVKYTVNNTFPVVSGDTLSIDFYFESEHDLTFFSSKVNFGVEILNEVVQFVKGNKAGNLNYSFVIPENCRKENMMNLQFEIASKLGSDNVYISVPVYNPPYIVNKELQQVEDFSEVSVKSFFSSKNLIIENDLLADLGETSGFSKFNVYELQNFNLKDYLYKESKSSTANNFIISNLLGASKKLVPEQKKLATASIFSISDLNTNDVDAKIARTSVLNNSKHSVKKAATLKSKDSKNLRQNIDEHVADKSKPISVAVNKDVAANFAKSDVVAEISMPEATSDSQMTHGNALAIEQSAIKHEESEFIENKRLNDIKIDIQLGLSAMKIEENTLVESKLK